MDIEKLSNFVNQVKSGEKKWLSRKLLITLSLIIGFFWMFKANAALILWQVTILAAAWLVCTTVMDYKNADCKQKTKELLIKSLSKDGLTSEEVTIIERT